MTFHDFPWINATLNGISAVLLVIGYICIRAGRWRLHAAMMVSALTTSAAFLACYVTYHYFLIQHHVVLSTFPRSAWRPTYLAILASHSILAVVILPMIFVTLSRALRRRWSWHRKVARITLPLWFYVSVTGVMVYWMLYRLAPTLRHG